MNILMNLEEKEPGQIDLKKLVLAINMKKASGGNYGNPGYVAPEVWKKNSYFQLKTDVFSFGRLINNLFFRPDTLVLEDYKDG
jgi:hypothetical protein